MSRVGMALCVVAVGACSGKTDDAAVTPRVVRTATAQAPRNPQLPKLRFAPTRAAIAGATGTEMRVHVVVDGTLPRDTMVAALSTDAACTRNFVDTAVVHNGPSVVGALVWIESGPSAIAGAVPERRPTVALEDCRLVPRVQIAAPGSTIQLVMRDVRAASMVVVPTSPSMKTDTVPFNSDGQLVPLRQRADSIGIIAISATRLPWARAFIAIAPSGVSALSDVDGMARFQLSSVNAPMTIRAWHPSLGVLSATVTPDAARTNPVVTLTFRR